MENAILIQNEDGSLTAEVLPDYGGMIARLRVGGRDVLFLDESLLVASPFLAGGIPILFPFAGKTKHDTYEIEGKKYIMPMHGLVKNRTFAVKGQSECAVTLWVNADDAILSRNYPFFHTLEISYQMIMDALIITAHIENQSLQPMPHAIGWHPYFKVSYRKQTQFIHQMAIHYDYVHEKDLKAPEYIELDKDWDDVFCQWRNWQSGWQSIPWSIRRMAMKCAAKWTRRIKPLWCIQANQEVSVLSLGAAFRTPFITGAR